MAPRPDTPRKVIGIDLGDIKSHLCVLSAEGVVEARITVRTTKKRLRGYFENITPVRVVIEAGTHSPWVSALLAELEHEVIVANPRRVHLIAHNTYKSDTVDAEFLARLGRIDPQLLAPIHYRSRDTRAALAVIRSRRLLVETRSNLINHVRGCVKSFGERLPKCSAEAFEKQARSFIPAPLATTLGSVLDVIAQANAEIRRLDQTIEKEPRQQLPAMVQVEQVDGVGAVTAATFVLTVENTERFAHSRSVGAYLGLTPRRSQSGGDDPELRISKAGDVYLRKLLVNCAQYILGPFGKESDLRRWGLALAQRGGKKAKRRAVVGVARRLAVLLHRLWVSGEVYVPVGYATPAV